MNKPAIVPGASAGGATHSPSFASTGPYWTTTADDFPEFAALGEDTTADVVVVGGGITGLTTAYLLAKAGKSVVVIERDRCANQDTGHTSAHLTMVTDARMSVLTSRFGLQDLSWLRRPATRRSDAYRGGTCTRGRSAA